MQIRWKFLLGINVPLLLLWLAHILTDQVWDRRDMYRLEARALADLGRVLAASGFEEGRPRPHLAAVVRELVQGQAGLEIMVLDQSSTVVAASLARRVGRLWQEPEIQQALDRGGPVIWQLSDHFHDGVAVLDVTVPVPGAHGKSHAIHLARRQDLVEDMLQEHRLKHTGWAFASILLVGLLVSVVNYRWLVKPVQRITGLVRASRWYPPAAPPRSGGSAGRRRRDELQRLERSVALMVEEAESAVQEKERLLAQVQTFNDKLEAEIRGVRRELAAAQAELVEKERFAAVGELAAALAHELRNPLHIVRGDAELLARRPENREECADILEEVDRINRFVNDLLHYTRPMEAGSEPEELCPVVRSAVEAVRRQLQRPEVTFEAECAEELHHRVDPEHLRQILVNLLSNGAEAVEGEGRVRARLRREERALVLEVSDDGQGIADADRESVFEPFFTRRPAGTGLGLSIVRRLCGLYGGAVSLQSEEGRGSTVSVRLPAAEE